jgi:prophage antirepressor-like protein
MENQLAIFENKPIRRVEHDGEMYFAVIDIISVLIETTSPRQYWRHRTVKITKRTVPILKGCFGF